MKSSNTHILLAGFYVVKGNVEEFPKGKRSVALITLNAKILGKANKSQHDIISDSASQRSDL